MTIEERIQALTQTVDLIFSMQKGNEEKMDANEEMLKRVFLQASATAQQIGEIERLIGALAHNSNTLIALAQEHEDRIGALEGNQAAS